MLKGKPMHIAIISSSFGFPFGKAATQRVRLIGRALTEQGAKVTVVCTRNTEKPDSPTNKNSKGIYDNVNYIYTSGNTIRPTSFIGRRIADIRGILLGIKWIYSENKRGNLNAIYSFITIQRVTVYRIIFSVLAQILGIPFIIEINERPWSLHEKVHILDRFLNPAFLSKGGIVISDYLLDYMENNCNQSKYNYLILPILVDTNEYSICTQKIEKWVTFAAAPGYIKELAFILEAMLIVWKKFPNIELHLLGGQSKERLLSYADNGVISISNKIVSHGYIHRTIYKEILSKSYVLLAPLFDDTRSQARFPTKIGEYLATGRPVVTTEVGEVEKYLSDGVNGFLAGSGSPESFADRIINVFQSEVAQIIKSKNHRAIAEQFFDFRKHSMRLYDYFSSICTNSDRSKE